MDAQRYADIITIKQGETFARSFTMSENGAPITGIADNLKSQVRDRQGMLLSTLVITETSIPGTYLFYSPENTLNWPLGGALMDFKYITSDGKTVPSETIFIRVQGGVTQ